MKQKPQETTDRSLYAELGMLLFSEKLGKEKPYSSEGTHMGSGIQLHKGFTISFLQIAGCLGNSGFKCLISTPCNRHIFITSVHPNNHDQNAVRLFTWPHRIIVLASIRGLPLAVTKLWKGKHPKSQENKNDYKACHVTELVLIFKYLP